MSLTFEFPQWKLRVSSRHGQEASAPRHSTEGEPADDTDWAADLAELDGDDDARDLEDVGGQVRQQTDDRPLPLEGAAPAAGVDARSALHPIPGPPPLAAAPRIVGGPEAGTGATPANRAAPHYSTAAPGTARGATPSAGSQRIAGGGPRAATAMAISGDAIPAEVLLLVLSGLRDVGDCMRAALVCRHWLTVVSLSNELWFELDSLQLAEGRWHRPPYAGQPLLRPPPGFDHPRSRMLSYKTTCALTQAAVRFMELRKGFEYVVEAAAALWLAACRAAGGVQGGQLQHPQCLRPGAATQNAASTACTGSLSPSIASVASHCGWEDGHGARDGWRQRIESSGDGLRLGAVVELRDVGGTGAASGAGRGSGGGEGSEGERRKVSGGVAVLQEGFSGGKVGVGCNGCGGTGEEVVARSNGDGSDVRQRGRITHVDQLWESCGQSRAALQVDERFNAVRVQQMVGKLCSSGGTSLSYWLPLYEGVAAVMTSRCDQIRDDLVAEAAAAAAAAAAHDAAAAEQGPSASASNSSPGSRSKRRRVAASVTGGGQARWRGDEQPLFRREVVYAGSSYADQFAELLRRGDTRGALALGSVQRRATVDGGRRGDGGGDGGGDGSGDGSGDGGGGLLWELDEPEMREVLMAEEHEGLEGFPGLSAAAAVAGGTGGPHNGVPGLPVGVADGLLLWQMLLRAWRVYRRWLEVWVVWCGPLGDRVEAERQLAGAAAAPGEAPLALPHPINKGLLLFRSQVLLAYPLRRPLQAAALWLFARAALSEDRQGDFSGDGSLLGGGGKGRRLLSGDGFGSGDGLSEDHGQLLTCIRKLLTELAVPDDATQSTALHTRQKLQRCFGRLLLRPMPAGGARALHLAQRMQGLRAAVGGGGPGPAFC